VHEIEFNVRHGNAVVVVVVVTTTTMIKYFGKQALIFLNVAMNLLKRNISYRI
jgi:hypothetical protein